ncbi:MAG TPA: nucleotide disphospho-sugar-binding domain-containing protein [Tepidisphaeraceae bacterium]|nr:nucleotide disphospho-sugar-binding domain-containing protein [Tepidisphaeraceae bacterium]
MFCDREAALRVLLIALGSHGDVHPFVGIGQTLRARGHDVRVVANPYFERVIDEAGLAFVPIGTSEEYQHLAMDPALWRRLDGTRTVLASLGKTLRPVYEAIADNSVRGDTVVAASTLAFGARVAQDHLGIPTATVHLQPSVFISALRPPTLPGTFMPAWLPVWMRRMQIRLIDRMADSMILPSLNSFRRELGLAPVRRALTRYMHSPQRVIGLFPDWFAPPAPDWPAQTRLTGFPLFDESETERLSEELLRFLEAGDPPMAFTPGSAMWSGHQFLAEAARSCERLGRRGLLLTRHAGHLPASLPPGVLHVGYAPFSALLPRCAALVHHGGIGTSAQALASGIPQLVVPHAHDQPDNADRLQRLGVARIIQPRQFRSARVAHALCELLGSSGVADRCHQIASRFTGSGPNENTADLIERVPDLEPAEGMPGAPHPTTSG